MPEEDTFAVLVKIMQDYRMREMFKPSMAELGLCMYQLDTLVQEHIPDLYVHFQSQAIHTNLYASSWFLTLFTTSLPLVLSCRVMDCFLSEGMEVIFRIALALLTMGKDELLLQDMEGVIKYFQKYMPAHFEANQEAVFKLAFDININQKKMKKLEKEYTTMKTREKEDEIEIRVSFLAVPQFHHITSHNFPEVEEREPLAETEGGPAGVRVQRAGGQVDPGPGGPGRGGRDDLRPEEGAGGPASARPRHQQQAGGGRGQVRTERGEIIWNRFSNYLYFIEDRKTRVHTGEL